MPILPITVVFDELPDPRRQTENQLHRLTDILTIATCAVISGAESWDAIAEYGQTKKSFLQRFLPLPNGIPSADTFARVFQTRRARLQRGIRAVDGGGLRGYRPHPHRRRWEIGPTGQA
jgi:hypothetical protein